MLSILRRRLATGIATTRDSALSEPPPAAFRGMPVILDANCRGDGVCADVCPTLAIHVLGVRPAPIQWTWRFDRAACTGCGLCIEACPHAALLVSPLFELASRTRADLVETVYFKMQSEGATP